MSGDLFCPVCGTEGPHEVVGCNWWKCSECNSQWDEDRRDDDSLPWKCYHCGEVCKTDEAAFHHFGRTQYDKPVCQIDAAQLRAIERELERYRAEDTELHRQIRAMQTKHARDLVREEERGYARGLSEGRGDF